MAISLVGTEKGSDELKYLRDIEKLLKDKIPEADAPEDYAGDVKALRARKALPKPEAPKQDTRSGRGKSKKKKNRARFSKDREKKGPETARGVSRDPQKARRKRGAAAILPAQSRQKTARNATRPPAKAAPEKRRPATANQITQSRKIKARAKCRATRARKPGRANLPLQAIAAQAETPPQNAAEIIADAENREAADQSHLSGRHQSKMSHPF